MLSVVDLFLIKLYEKMRILNLENIESKERDYVFVTNISGTSADARNITKDILQKYHLMEE